MISSEAAELNSGIRYKIVALTISMRPALHDNNLRIRPKSLRFIFTASPIKSNIKGAIIPLNLNITPAIVSGSV